MAESADDLEPITVQTLLALWDSDFIPLGMGNFVFLLASGLAIVLHGAVPKWIGWVAIVLALTALTPLGFFAFLGGGIWILILSVMLTLRFRAAGTSPA
jgi:hypothetical protein